ncbi:PREDICTED: uncharacterized protein LOC101303169 [Fragaria vesca subsp. vesca]
MAAITLLQIFLLIHHSLPLFYPLLPSTPLAVFSVSAPTPRSSLSLSIYLSTCGRNVSYLISLLRGPGSGFNCGSQRISSWGSTGLPQRVLDSLSCYRRS